MKKNALTFMFSRTPDSMALRTIMYEKRLNRKSIWRTKIKVYLERNNSSSWLMTRGKSSENSTTIEHSLDEIKIARHWHTTVCREKSKWRHILAHKQEVVITMDVSEIETQFLRLNLCFRGRLDQRNTDRQQNMHVCYTIQ